MLCATKFGIVKFIGWIQGPAERLVVLPSVRGCAWCTGFAAGHARAGLEGGEPLRSRVQLRRRENQHSMSVGSAWRRAVLSVRALFSYSSSAAAIGSGAAMFLELEHECAVREGDSGHGAAEVDVENRGWRMED